MVPFDLTGTSDGHQATGTEKWILFSNDTWEQQLMVVIVKSFGQLLVMLQLQVLVQIVNRFGLTASINRNATTCPQGSG